MASSQRSAVGAAGAPTEGAPTPEVTAFFTLVEKVDVAAVLNRHARCAELSNRAAEQAEGLWGNKSLVVASLRVVEAAALREVAGPSISFSEQGALRRRAWAILLPVHALLLRRLADDTLLPGTIKEEEVTYLARSQAFVLKAMDKPVP